ncbi:MAG: hypothetical protein LBD77_00395 [Bifidobacteriaceae bacterium]|jgi:hypothetical protein|nr:hypothetical protein [Bifidobacteriaceae bacterium]
MAGNRHRRLRFTRYELTRGVSFAAQVDTSGLWTGIYVLEFANGHEYVGQATHFPTRLATHRRRWPDLTAARFAPAADRDLDQLEQAMIDQRGKQGAQLRNQVGVIASAEPTTLDLDEGDAAPPEWITAEPGVPQVAGRWREPKGEAQDRPTATEAWRKLKMHDDYDGIVQTLALYVAYVINPRPDQTEGKGWYLSALPSTSRSRDHHRLAALSINNVEALVIMEGRESGAQPWEAFCFMNTAPVAVPRWAAPETEAGYYKTTGKVTTVFARLWPDLSPLLLDRQMLQAARSLAHGLLRKGPGMFARFHNYHLADDVFGRVQELASRWPPADLVSDQWLRDHHLTRDQLGDQPRRRFARWLT